jgi:putative NIF3 family GTP cyclohydrolase 1 type 2
MAHGINLFAYHLPLDAHAELGNNAQLGLRLGCRPTPVSASRTWVSSARRARRQRWGWLATAQARWGEPAAGAAGRRPAAARVAWCTGGAQGYFEAAIAAGADAFVTGEISEPQAHLARETGVAFLACGHHATERFGAPAVAAMWRRSWARAPLHRDRQPGMTQPLAPCC